MEKISAIIITKNEERNIERCLNSLKDVADEMIVVDSGSTDATGQICLRLGARFVHHDWEGYAGQKNYANSLASHPWILSIDADEALSAELGKSIADLKQREMRPDEVYSFNRLTNYCGHWIRHCGWYPDRCTRLWHKDMAHWEGLIHEYLNFHGSPRHTTLCGDLLHYSYYTVGEHVDRMARYAPLSAEAAFREGKRCGAVGLWLRPAWTFVRGYILHGGFLDGAMGYTICRLSATYTLVKYSTLYNLQHATTD